MKILDSIITFISKTLGEFHFPFVNKNFDLNDYFDIEKMIRDFTNPFMVGLVKTYGNGSNFLVWFAQLFSKNKKKRNATVTHAIAHIGVYKGYKHKVIESVGEGIIQTSLLKAIGQRDVVVLRAPNPKYFDDKFCNYVIDYIKAVAYRDSLKNIEYDYVHDYTVIPIEDINDHSKNNIHLDCSETIYQALQHGFRMTGQESIIKMEKRAGKMTWSPIDILFSDLFITIYDSRSK